MTSSLAFIQRRPQFFLFIFIGITTIIRIWTAQATGLSDVEAYYWTWSQHLDWSYFDHGPMVAFIIRLGTQLFGDTPLGVRIGFVMISAVTLWLIAYITQTIAKSVSINFTTSSPDEHLNYTDDFTPQILGLASAVVLWSIPVFQIAGAAANPDVPFIASLLVVMLFLHRTLNLKKNQVIRLYLYLSACGLLIGFGACAKIIAILLGWPLGFVIWHRMTKITHRLLACLLSILSAILAAFPLIFWNSTHHWAMLLYHLKLRHTKAPGFSIGNFLKLIGGQMGYYSPFILTLLGIGVFNYLKYVKEKKLKNSSNANFLLLLFSSASFLAFGYFLILIIPSAEPHWTDAGYVSLTILFSLWLPRLWFKAKIKKLVKIAFVYSMTLALIAHLHILTDLGIQIIPKEIYQPRYDLSNELRGWPEVASAIQETLLQRKLYSMKSNTPVVGCHYTTCSQLWFSSRGRFKVYCPTPRIDQFDFFPDGDGTELIKKQKNDLLYVKDERFPFDAKQLYKCRSYKTLKKITIRRSEYIVRTFELQLCKHFAGMKISVWPIPHPSS